MNWLSAHHIVLGGIIGLAVGLFFTALTWYLNLAKRRELSREVNKLREHLHTQMEITAKGSQSLKQEAELLRQQNENLRVTIKEWQAKPGRNEMRMLLIYDKAVRILNQTAPGFSPVWEKAVREAEDEIVASESGVTALIKRAFRPFSSSDRLTAHTGGPRPVGELENGKTEGGNRTGSFGAEGAAGDDPHGTRGV
ncbi:MAG: hypothetical protein JO295_09495 [Verrucomicrobia bacterium]|nr:hypothetical protein [Verrucomicrobiota bacterium]